ncbi:VOC family protein [uncultured Nocardioides sp.]|uniref:VOC family protein n=1 Tax=uncultured Nocardioides sp. TaxID=198441 RepID=UPI0026076187|nr:VOC family protein [uncultured Nocardioides sp.]
MTLRIQCLTIDCHDLDLVATFWAEALGWRLTFADDVEICLEPPQGELGDGLLPDLLFIKVPDEKTMKNRVHLDLRPGAGDTQEAEVARLEALGATRADIGQGETRWTVMADPEGNEFCVLQPLEPEQQAEVDASIAAWR